uniref:Uncharacterized protein n=1 Tax=Anguilla anguilla TaxID=7936 RepID=A0A0E9XM99_ANGAN
MELIILEDFQAMFLSILDSNF